MTTKAQDKHKMSEIDEGISKLFDIKKRLGKGAYGIVWKALDRRTNETIAVKKIFDAFRDETDAQRTFREIMFLKAFRSHPNIVKLHNIYKASNNLDIYLIFEYMESDLHNIIKRGTILKDIHKRYVMYQLLNALKYIHSGNVIHRDLKPSNILIDSKCRCKLADFGLARSVAKHAVNNNDVASDKPSELLLTDYVATRWYRAPEILVASKRYTKGIDMWSLGCILAEMIRGKPIFQGSSTVNQIEKIVYTLPDITEDDVRSVGAGFGSALLNKQVLKDKKTTLNDLLCGASGDALDLVKSLLVLDPAGRLTAQQALNHTYVEKFRSSLPELELNIDILPPFRDDIRLTVPEYRSKLYEIVQTHGDKNKSLSNNKQLTNSIKIRENKSVHNLPETSELRKSLKVKQSVSHKEEDDSQRQLNANLSTIVQRALKKTVPLNKSKTTKNHNNTIGDGLNIKDEAHCQHDKSRGHQSSHPHRHGKGDQLFDNQKNARKFSANEEEFSKTLANAEALKSASYSKRLHRSNLALNKMENDINNKMEIASQHTPPPTLKNRIRHTKSEVIPLGKSACIESSKVKERICYERQLKKLEEEVELYKKEVNTFCRETLKSSQQKHMLQRSNENIKNTQAYSLKNMPKKQNAVGSSPIKNIYFQLLTKGQRKDYNKSDLDLSGNSGNASNSSDYLRNSYNSNACSSRSKVSQNSQYNRSTSSHLSSQQLLQDQKFPQQYHRPAKHQQSQQYCCRPLTKFV